MRFLPVLLLAGSALIFCVSAGGCGSGGSEATSSEVHPFGTITRGRNDAELKIDVPKKPPPQKLIIRDLEVGSGQVAHRGDYVTIFYAGVNYTTGVRTPWRWPPSHPRRLKLGFENFGDYWEEGIEGMRAGGLRELLVPEAFGPGGPPIDYVVRLVHVDPQA